MRGSRAALVALPLALACARFGYEPQWLAAGPTALDDAAPSAENPPDLSSLASAGGASALPDSSAAPGDGGPDTGAAEEAADAGRFSTVEAGPPDLCPERSDALFCDGFEDASFSRWSYPVITNGSVEQSTAFARSGTGSMHATTGSPGANNFARYAARAFDHQMSGEIWLRSYYYLPSSTNVTTTFSTAVVSEIEPPYFGFSLVVRATGVDIGSLQALYPGTLEFPRDHWTCVELHVTIDPAQGVFEAYLDGQLAARSPAIDTQPDQGYTVLDAGIHYTDAAQGPVEVYVDDVVAGNARVGCDP